MNVNFLANSLYDQPSINILLLENIDIIYKFHVKIANRFNTSKKLIFIYETERKGLFLAV